MRNSLLFILSFFPFLINAQIGKTDELDDLLDEFLLEDEDFLEEFLETVSQKHFMYFSNTVNTNTFFAGRSTGVDQISSSPQLTYLHTNGLYVGLSGIYLDKFDPKWDVTIASVGFSKSIGKKKLFKYQTSYSRYFFTDNSNASFDNALDFGVGLKNKKRNLSTQLSGTYLFGDDNSFQLVWRSYYSHQLYRKNSFNIKIRPQLSFIAGTQTVFIGDLFLNADGTITDNLSEEEIFKLFNIKLNIPVLFNYKDFDVEIGYTQNFAQPIGDETDLPSLGNFHFSVGYLFAL